MESIRISQKEMVQVSNAPTGRTYIDYNWEPKNDLSDFRRVDPRFPEDYVQTATPHIVPNGKWVMERPPGWAWLIGVEFDELETLQFTDKRDVRYVLYVSDKPFGYIVADEEDVDRTVYPEVIKPTGRRILFCAKQIHKGELGQTVPIERLSYVRQAFEPGQKSSVRKARERKRSNLGWVRLADLVAATGLSVEDIVLGFWGYSGHRNSWVHNNNQEGGVLLDIITGLYPTNIKHQCPEVRSVTGREAEQLIRPYVNYLWVRRGFAYTILRLLALGVRPEVNQPA